MTCQMQSKAIPESRVALAYFLVAFLFVKGSFEYVGQAEDLFAEVEMAHGAASRLELAAAAGYQVAERI